jgi:magnesium transporter
MNFEIMPELSWDYGYLFSVGIMILSAITPLIIFRKKGWI